MHLLKPSIQRYAWGTAKFIPELLGIQPDGGPYAELWYGSHPNSPSTLADGSAFTAELPYLLKVLSIATPLSIQAHPTKAQAYAGFRREEVLGIDSSDPHRNYKDDNHKPETIVALEGGIEARAGMRTPEEIDDIIASFGKTALEEIWLSSEVSSEPTGLIQHLAQLEKANIDTLINDLLVSQLASHFVEQYPDDARWLEECARLYPGDAGVIIQLLMNYVWLAPGQGLHMNAGELHAYLRGNGVEIMACSDNVIRAGLTPKSVDLNELFKVVDFSPSSPRVDQGSSGIFSQDIPDYKLHSLQNGESLSVAGPSVSLCINGLAKAVDQKGRHLSATRGRAVFSQDQVDITSTGQVFVATPNN